MAEMKLEMEKRSNLIGLKAVDVEVIGDQDVYFMQETVKVLGKRWAIPILKEIHKSPREKAGFRELQNRLNNISAKVLSERLKDMVEHDLLKRRVNPNLTPVRVNYHLTRKGSETFEILNNLIRSVPN